jgi:hypothetical protein
MSSARSLSELASELQYYGKKKQAGVSLKALMETGMGNRLKDFSFSGSMTPKASVSDRVKIQVACFLHRELPVRLAHRACELEEFPLFSESKHINNVRSWYQKSFQQIRETAAPTDLDKEELFAKAIESIYERHSHTLVTMAMGAHEIRQKLNHDINSFAEHGEIQERLDDFYLSRIGIRMVRESSSILLCHGEHFFLTTTTHSPPNAAHRSISRTPESSCGERHDWASVAGCVPVRYCATGDSRRRVHVHQNTRGCT